MPRFYLGKSLNADRQVVKPIPDGIPDPTPGKADVVPELTIFDPNGEPLEVGVEVPHYGEESTPLVAVHLVAVPNDSTKPADEAGWMALVGEGVVKASAALTGIVGQVVPVELAGVPDGAVFIQSILEVA